MNDSWYLVPLVILWIAWSLQAMLSALQVRRLAKRVSEPSSQEAGAFRPKATIILPVKGIDLELPKCIEALCTQDYPEYSIVCVVESTEDPAYQVLEQELARFPDRSTRLMIAGMAGPDIGQKVHNQLAALVELDKEAGDEEVWVFADSDIVPDSRWLGEMAGGLHTTKTGATTGYRWMIPAGRSATVWSQLACCINNSIACVHRSRNLETAWGGSMAVLVATAREGKLIERFRGELTDDLPLTLMCRSIGKRVRFRHQTLLVTPVKFTLGSFFEFARRQYVLVRVYTPLLYLFALGITTLYVSGWISAWACLIGHLVWRPENDLWLWSGGAIALVFLANQYRASKRCSLVRAALGEQTLAEMGSIVHYDRWTTILWMTLHWLVVISAVAGRRVRWRTVEYRLFAPGKVERIS